MPKDKEPRERTRGRRSGRVRCPPKTTRPVAERQDQPGSNTWTRPRCTRRAPLNKTILAFNHHCEQILSLAVANMTVWPSGLRRWLQAPVRKGVGSNLTAVTASRGDHWKHDTRAERQRLRHRCRFGHPKHEGPEWGNQTRQATDTYDWGSQCPKTRNHEKEHEEDEAEELHAPPPKQHDQWRKGRINQAATHGHAPDTQGRPP